jgi:hypothetical protein
MDPAKNKNQPPEFKQNEHMQLPGQHDPKDRER